MKRSSAWRGGKHVQSGYVWVWCTGHPRAMSNGYVREHILIVERAMGKPLRETAEVHHVNKIRHDNRPRNLVACDSLAYHALLHRRARALKACSLMPGRRRTCQGDMRSRCPLDGKVILPSQGIAERKAALIREESPEHASMGAYCCAAGYWHIGHSRRRETVPVLAAGR